MHIPSIIDALSVCAENRSPRNYTSLHSEFLGKSNIRTYEAIADAKQVSTRHGELNFDR